MRHFVAHRKTRRRFVSNLLSRRRYHSDRYMPFGYSRSMYRSDKKDAISGRLFKGSDI